MKESELEDSRSISPALSGSSEPSPRSATLSTISSLDWCVLGFGVSVLFQSCVLFQSSRDSGFWVLGKALLLATPASDCHRHMQGLCVPAGQSLVLSSAPV